LCGVFEHLAECVVPCPFTEAGVDGNIPAEDRLDARADVAITERDRTMIPRTTPSDFAVR